MSRSPCVVVVTAPSGSGKTTLARRLMDAYPDLRFSISATTRSPRPGEVDGTHYHFLSDSAFDRAIEDGRFLEWEEVYPGCRYGTLIEAVASSSADAPLLLDIDVRGATNFKQQFGNQALTIFIRPPSIEELRRRLELRQSESAESLERRLATAAEEMAFEHSFDRIVVNDDLETAASEIIMTVGTFLQECRRP